MCTYLVAMQGYEQGRIKVVEPKEIIIFILCSVFENVGSTVRFLMQQCKDIVDLGGWEGVESPNQDRPKRGSVRCSYQSLM